MARYKSIPKKESHWDRKEKRKDRAEMHNKMKTVVLPTLAAIVVLIILYVIAGTRSKQAS